MGPRDERGDDAEIAALTAGDALDVLARFQNFARQSAGGAVVRLPPRSPSIMPRMFRPQSCSARSSFPVFLWAAAPASAQQAASETKKVEASLASETETVHPGQSFWISIEQKIAPGWHTYWMNPGDFGEPTNLKWRTPDGFRIGPIQWPTPEAMRGRAGVDYGYSGEAMLLARVNARRRWANGSR